MSAATDNSIEVLQEAILSEARQASEEIVRKAKQEAENLLSAARVEIQRGRNDALNQARSDAARRKELILSTISVEAGRLRSSRIESLLESIRAESQKVLLSPNDAEYREALVALSAHAISRMEGDAFTIHISEKDKDAFNDGLAVDIQNRVHRSPLEIVLSYDADFSGRGPIIEDSVGRQFWDNRLLSRLNRLWPELRQRIALDASLVASGAKTGDKP